MTEEAQVRPKRYLYRSEIKWEGSRKGSLASLGKPTIQVAPPPEFKGFVGIWTPEDLLVAAVNSCLMLTFLYHINQGEIELVSYESEAEGILEMVEGKLIVSEVKILPRLSVRSPVDEEKIKTLFRLSKENCFISNSIKARIEIIPELKILNPGAK